MGAIKGKGNKTTEVRLRMALVRQGLGGFRLHAAQLPGRPDFYFSSEQVAVFVDGCFWHGCPICGHTPKTRSAFWLAKFERNQARDRKNVRLLRIGGIKVIRFWEHQLNNAPDLRRAVARIQRNILK
jgi:DNA mismatch endonuclease Vsr